jgi:hypothetical protein
MGQIRGHDGAEQTSPGEITLGQLTRSGFMRCSRCLQQRTRHAASETGEKSGLTLPKKQKSH